MRRAVAAAVLALASAGASAQDGEGYERTPPVALDDLLPEGLIASGQHRVVGASYAGANRVAFDIESDIAQALQAESIALAVIRIYEMQTLAQATNQFEQQNRELAEEVRGQIRVGADSFVDILGSPLDTSRKVVGQFGRNVGKTFEEFGRFPGPKNPSRPDVRAREREDPVFRSHRRNVASQLALDVYSSNPAVQRFLDTVARARMGGRARAGITTVSISRRPEVQVDGGRVQERIRTAVLNAEEGRLLERNAGLLQDAGVGPELVRRFMEHPVLTPTHQSAITEYLAFMSGVANRAAVVEASLDARNEVEALAAVQAVRMYAHYHESWAPLRELIAAGHLTLAVSNEGSLLIALPFDVLFWDQETDRVFSALAEFSEDKGIFSRAVLLPGNASRSARDALEKRGFQTYDRFLFQR